MTDQQRCQQAATASPCPEKGAALQLTPRHLELIHAAALALHRVTDKTVTGASTSPLQRPGRPPPSVWP